MKPIESPWKKQRNKVLRPKHYGYKNDAYFLISPWTLWASSTCWSKSLIYNMQFLDFLEVVLSLYIIN